ncbi:MAG: hypothetical protein WD512_20000, partial [Candidatus Paceibacterota bacterium]
PSAIIQGAVQPEEASILVKAGEKQLYLTTLVNQNVKSVQVLEMLNQADFPETEVKMLLWNLQSIFNCRVEGLTLIGNHFHPEQLTKALDLPVSKLDIPGADAEIIAIQAATALAMNPANIISNFRDRTLSSNKSLKLFVQYCLKLKFYILAAILFLIAIPIFNYIYVQQEINLIQASLRDNIAQRIPWVKFPEGKELETLMATSGQIEAQLESLGSPAKSEPVDVYLVLSDMLSEATGSKIEMDLQQLVIQGNQVDIDGTVPNYKGVDRLEKLIKDKKDIFCRIKVETPGGGVDKRFQFKIRLC